MARRKNSVVRGGRTSGEGTPRQAGSASVGKLTRKTIPLLLGEDVARGLLDYVDLAVRYLTADQRGRTSLYSSDEARLRTMVETLAKYRDALPSAVVGRRPRQLSPDQAALGTMRRDFDDLCRFAVGATPSSERDELLAQRLWMICQSEGRRFAIQRSDVDGAMVAVKRMAAARGRDESMEQLSKDWLRTSKTSDLRNSAVSASGELLRNLMQIACVTSPDRAHSTQGRVRMVITGASFSGSSTSEYARNVTEADAAFMARHVSPLERLTFLATVLGARLDEAHWVALQLGLLLSGQRLLGRDQSDGELRLSFSTREPVGYQLLDWTEWDAMFKEVSRSLVLAGLRDSKANETELRVLLKLLSPWPTENAGMTIPPTTTRPAPPSNPWTVDRATGRSLSIEHDSESGKSRASDLPRKRRRV